MRSVAARLVGVLLWLTPLTVIAGNEWSVGDKVRASDYRGVWYDAQIVGEKGGKFEVQYAGWSKDWNEWVTPDRIKRKQGQQKAAHSRKVVMVEFDGSWYEGALVEEGQSYGVKTYKVKYGSSGGEEWVAPNRVSFNKNQQHAAVGAKGHSTGSLKAGTQVSIEYNGGWYPGRVLEVGDLFGTRIFKVTYTQSGLQEWVASNRVKGSS